ncbi:DUF2066 domain-containing protein [Rhodospirillaceae bacterium KN72]|uniref:DUF2066 domain-containing protein n=1 Tax=Pacificispira spongiicola TaxID=2729598 RepID=A0A7Y0E2P6_9PROT|nr:DUF2066 domain-containing protein [Pacificispira spongiicola]NMM46129.1 DUF2066 domain-containing protein [Pacificispira spongiicola]
MAERPSISGIFGKSGLFVALAGLLLAAGAAASPVRAQDLYAVTGLPVDERAANEVEAKQIGIANAKTRALQIVIDRLTVEPEYSPGAALHQDPQQLDLPDGERLEFMIRDLSFQNEKFGGGRYLAEMTIRFHPEEVNRFLQRAGKAYLAGPSPKAVILPIYRNETGDLLWSDANPWLDAWWRLDTPSPIVPYTVPLGDLADIAAIDVRRALNIDAAAINAIAARYQAGAVIVPVATKTPDGGMLVEVSTFGAGWPSAPELVTIHPSTLTSESAKYVDAQGEDAAPLVAAAAIVRDALDTRWKRANILRFDESAETLTARVGLVSGLTDWLSVRQVLNGLAPVKSWRLSELATNHAVVEIDFVGNTARLQQAFARSALQLTPPGAATLPGLRRDEWALVRP